MFHNPYCRESCMKVSPAEFTSCSQKEFFALVKKNFSYGTHKRRWAEFVYVCTTFTDFLQLTSTSILLCWVVEGKVDFLYFFLFLSLFQIPAKRQTVCPSHHLSHFLLNACVLCGNCWYCRL